MEQNAFLQIIKGLLTVIGLSIALVSGLLGLLIVISLIVSPESRTPDTSTAGLAVVILGMGLGGALAWHTGNSLLKRNSARWNLPPVWLLLLLYIPILIIGQLIISFDLFPFLIFPPFHILAGLLSLLIILAYASRALLEANVRWREIIVQLSGGAFLATTLAFTLEIILGLGILVLVLAITALTPGGLETLTDLANNLQDPTWLENPENIGQILSYPPVLITLGIIFIILAPLIEEFVKGLGVVFMSYRRPSMAQAFLWGLAGGAGLGLVENLFNTLANLEAWAFIITLRLGATLMHCLGTGVVALGWQRYLTEGRPWKLFGAYGLSVFTHGLWNATVAGVAGLALFATGSATEVLQMMAGGGAVFLLLLLALLIIGMLFALVVITRLLQRELAAAPAATEPVALLTAPATASEI